MHYAIGDVHGCFDEMIRLIDKIEKQDSDAKFIFVGDFMDRGPKVYETLQWMMKHITENGKYQCVMGNHEALILEWYQEFKKWSVSADNFETLPVTEYDFLQMANDRDLLTDDWLVSVTGFFCTLPFRKEIVIDVTDKNRSCSDNETHNQSNRVKFIIAHAWDDENETNDDRRCEINLWDRCYKGNISTDSIIIHGHTPTINLDFCAVEDTAPGMIAYRKNAINIDGGCTFYDMYKDIPTMLCGICLETLEEFYAETIEENLMKSDESITLKQAEMMAEGYRQNYLNKENVRRRELLERIKHLNIVAYHAQ